MYDRPTSVILNRTSIALIIGYKSFHEFLRVSKKEHNTDTKRDRHRHRESETQGKGKRQRPVKGGVGARTEGSSPIT